LIKVLKKDLATIEGKLEKLVEELKVWQEANCRGCSNAKEVLVGTGLECCDYSYNKKILEDGTCERGKAHKAKLDSKRASVVPKEGTETEEPTDNTPQSEREGKSGIPPDSPAAKAIHALHTSTPIPAGVRRDIDVPKAECEGCKLASEDHTIGTKIRDVVPTETDWGKGLNPALKQEKVTNACTADSCPINTADIAKKIKKNKEPKAQPTIQRKAVETEKGIDNNETKTKTVSETASDQKATEPPSKVETSEPASLKAKGRKTSKNSSRGASHLTVDNPPAGVGSAKIPLTLK